MSTSCFIFPADTKLWEDPDAQFEWPIVDLRIDRQDFAKKLKEKFPHLKEVDTFELNTETENGVLVYVTVVEGGYTTAYIRQPYAANFFEFILWYREYVPDRYELYFNCVHRSFDGLKLTSETTVEDIKAFLAS